MSEHESVRELLALAASGVLNAGEQRQVEEHVRDCESCRAELDAWGGYTRGLGQLRQPALPAKLMERTRARILQERATASGQRTENLMLSALAAFAWILGLTSWVLLRVFTRGVVMFFGANLAELLTWSVASTMFVWVTAAATGLALGKWRREMRRVL